MADRITANLPSRDFKATAAFYARLGFAEVFRGTGWMILRRGPLELEFFPHADLDPAQSAFSACIRLDDIEGLLQEWRGLGLSVDPKAIPRLTGIFRPSEAPRMFALIDLDGSLLRCIDNGD
ncbi:bleomycin resistance protein [Pseudorhodobacter sp.]|uniref:bleomycin resistance protein n=1 Tax=Pseudorhodobacter sp. TaxID=1934400 RepID=UPI0026497127|nr:bleomycin resistance protein [Pseudorhodobacter sp.]MDN5786405.1 bleomycin resistance protein [Pseudorhodobacter sp.]